MTRLVKSWFGFGLSLIEQKGVNLCQNEKVTVLTESRIKDVFEVLRFDTNTDKDKAMIGEIKKSLLKKLESVFIQKELDPLLDYVLTKSKFIKYENIISLDKLLGVMFSGKLTTLKEELESQCLFCKNEHKALSAKNQLLSLFLEQQFGNDESLIRDFRMTHKLGKKQFETPIENEYRQLINESEAIFKRISELIMFVKADSTNILFEGITNMFYKVLLPKLVKVFTGSELNKSIHFLDNNGKVNFSKLVDYLVTLNLIPVDPQSKRFACLDLFAESTHQRSSEVKLI